MYYPFRDEGKLQASNPPNYSEKYMNPIVYDIIIVHQRLLELFLDFFDDPSKGYKKTLVLIRDTNHIDYELQVGEEIY